MFTPRRSLVMFASRQSSAPGLYGGHVAQMWRELVGFPGGHLHRRERHKLHADFRLAAGTIDQAGGRNRLATGSTDRLQALARRDAGRDDVLDHQNRLVLFELEVSAE